MVNSLISRPLVWSLGLGLTGLALLAVTLLLGASPSGLLSSPAPATPPAGETPAAKGVVCFGQVDLEHGLTSLFPLQPGRVAEILVSENEHVDAGKTLIRLEDDLARSRVAEAQAALEAAQVRLARAKELLSQSQRQIAMQQAALSAMQHRLAAARKTYERQQRLAKQKLVDELELATSAEHIKELEDLEKVEVEKLQSLQEQDPALQVRQAEKDIALMEARLQQARLALEEYEVKAPRAGTVLRVLVGIGDVVATGAEKPAVLFAADGPQVVRAEVEQEFVNRIRAGQRAVVIDDGGFVPDPPTWTGRVEQVAGWFGRRRTVVPDPLAMNDVLTAECLIKLDPGQPPLRIGQRVRVQIGAVSASGQ